MLVARDGVGVRRVAAGAAAGEGFFCPGCNARLVVRAGTRTVQHFAHRPGQRCDTAVLRAARRKAAAERRRELAAHRRDTAEQVSGQQTLFG